MSIKSKTVLDAIEQIYNCCDNSAMNNEKMVDCQEELKLIMDYFNLPLEETIFAVIVFCFELSESTCNLNEIRNFLGLNDFNFLPYRKHLQNLLDVGYIEKKHNNHYSRRTSRFEYCLNPELFDCVVENQPMPENLFCKLKEDIEWVEMMANFIENDLEFVDKKELDAHYLKLCKRIEDGSLIGYFNKLGLSVNHSLLLTHIIWSNYLGESFVSVDDVLAKLFNSRLAQMREFKSIKEEKHLLCIKDLIESRPARFMNGAEVRVSESFRLRLTEMGISIETKEMTNSSCISHQNLTTKPLIFSDKINNQLTKLEGVIKESNYKKVKKRMIEKGLRPGVTALFFGKPGTGKTESVMQFAKKYKRDIIHVDISESKSMWFGQSEKLIKRIFTRYKEILDESAIAPILLLNEADAILGKRKTNGKSSVDNTENAIQNILLEELENFEGILIATTNLATNLDAAFDRRFLFKVEFENPGFEQRLAIWKMKLPKYDENVLSKVAFDFELSGGQIDNIIRKLEIEFILNRAYPNEASFIDLCEQEQILSKNQSNKIGF